MPTRRSVAVKVVPIYGRALFDASSADSTVDGALSSLREVLRTIRGHAQLKWTLTDVLLAADARKAIAADVFSGTHPAVVEVMKVMIDRDELDLLSAVNDAFQETAERERGVAVVDVTTAVPLTEDLRASLDRKLSADLGKGVSLRESVDARILGGVIISTGGTILDGSVATQLANARVVLSTAQTGGEE